MLDATRDPATGTTGFGRVADVAVDGNGRIYVLDQLARHVRVFDADGVELDTIGQAGRGPGELTQGAVRVLVAAGDTILIPDALLRRMNRFGPDGEFVGSTPVADGSGVPVEWKPATGRCIVHQVRTSPQRGARATELLLIKGARGNLIDTLYTGVAGAELEVTSEGPSLGLFVPSLTWIPLDSRGVALGDGSAYRIALRDYSGAVRLIVTRDIARHEVTQHQRDEVIALLRESLESQLPPARLQSLLDRARFPPQFPAFLRLLEGPGGTLWVERVTAGDTLAFHPTTLYELDFARSGRWDVFAGDGRYLETVAVPTSVHPVRFADGHLYGVERDELGRESVVRFRLRRGSGPADSGWNASADGRRSEGLTVQNRCRT